MYEVLVNRLGGLSLPRKSGVRLTDRPDMTLDVGRKTTQPQPTGRKEVKVQTCPALNMKGTLLGELGLPFFFIFVSLFNDG